MNKIVATVLSIRPARKQKEGTYKVRLLVNHCIHIFFVFCDEYRGIICADYGFNFYHIGLDGLTQREVNRLIIGYHKGERRTLPAYIFEI